jgi:hypothetical protein
VKVAEFSAFWVVRALRLIPFSTSVSGGEPRLRVIKSLLPSVKSDEHGERITRERCASEYIKLNEIVAGSHIRKYLFV